MSVPTVLSSCDIIRCPMSSKVEPAKIKKDSAIVNIIAVLVFLDS